VPLEGFNHGSSPSVLRGVALGGRSVVLLSDEAPAALLDGVRRHRSWLAGLTNAVAAAEFGSRRPSRQLVQDRVRRRPGRARPGRHDRGGAARGAARSRGAASTPMRPSASSGAARYCLSVLRTTKDPLDGIWAAAAAAELRSVGLEEDLAIASEVAVSDVVPRVGGVRDRRCPDATVRLVAG
jgi:2-phosphosulfolactate phosphatase